MSHSPEEPSEPPRSSDITSRLRSGRQYLNPNILRPQATQSIDIPVETGDQITSIDIDRSITHNDNTVTDREHDQMLDTHTDNTVTDIEGYPVTLNPGSPTNSIEDEYPSEDLNHYDDLWMSDQEENLAYENQAGREHQEEDYQSSLSNLFDNENSNNSVVLSSDTHDPTHAHTHAQTSDIANTSDTANSTNSPTSRSTNHAIAPIMTPPKLILKKPPPLPSKN